MNTYTKFIVLTFLKSLFFVFLIFLSLIILLNILTELEFFQEKSVSTFFPIYISLLNAPTLVFEMFPFVFLISTQVFFINLFNNNQIQIFKYSGLKNSTLIKIISVAAFLIGIFLVAIFYNFSSNLQNIYLELKNKYSSDDKYLAVVTKNGLWIRDKIDERILFINSTKIDGNYLIDTFITEFDNEFEVKKNIKSDKVNIKNNLWLAYDAKVFENGTSNTFEVYKINSNFNYKKIQSLFSNLSSLSLIELFNLKKNYMTLNYSTTEVDLQLQKLISYPIYLTLMTILSSIIMFGTKNLTSSTFKISFGLFASVIIYYMNNFFNVLGKTEKLSIYLSIWIPILLLFIISLSLSLKVNEK